MSIGPSLPPHLHHLAGGGGGRESTDEDDEVGPRLPQIPCRGPKPLTPGL